MILAVLRYLVGVALYLPLRVLAIPLAPLVAITSFYTRDGNLPGWLYWMQTQDAPLDEYKKYYTTKNVWWGRTLWIWRNPCQSFQAAQLGFIRTKNESKVETIRPTWEWIVVENRYKQKAFLLWFRFPTFPGRYGQVWIGWELQRQEETALHQFCIQLGKKEK